MIITRKPLSEVLLGEKITIIFLAVYKGNTVSLNGTVLGMCSSQVLPDPTSVKIEHIQMVRQMDQEKKTSVSQDIEDLTFLILKTSDGELHYLAYEWFHSKVIWAETAYLYVITEDANLTVAQIEKIISEVGLKVLNKTELETQKTYFVVETHLPLTKGDIEDSLLSKGIETVSIGEYR